MPIPGKLYIAGTPIGNLEDISDRLRKVFTEASMVACEDTRVTSRLCARLSVRPKLVSVHEHSSASAVDHVCDAVQGGEIVVYVSDAGTPGMNDPGGKLVARAFERGLTIIPIPGPSALTCAISVCGFPMDEFIYLGFVPHKKGRASFFQEISDRKSASVFLESTHRMMKAMDALCETLAEDRLIFVGRELSKLHETLYRGTAIEVREQLTKTSLKGEFTIIISPLMRKASV